MPGFPAKTVHFPLWPTGALAPQASLAALAIPTSRESAGFFCENGALSPAADVVPAPHASLAALAVSPSRESAGLSRENGSLSPVARRDTGSTCLSRRTCSLSLPGKCRVFPRKWFTFPRGMRLQGRSSRACLGKCLVYRHSEKEHLLDLG